MPCILDKIHCQWMFLHGVRQGSNFIFLPGCIQFPEPIFFLINSTFPIVCSWHLCIVYISKLLFKTENNGQDSQGKNNRILGDYLTRSQRLEGPMRGHLKIGELQTSIANVTEFGSIDLSKKPDASELETDSKFPKV